VAVIRADILAENKEESGCLASKTILIADTAEISSAAVIGRIYINSAGRLADWCGRDSSDGWHDSQNPFCLAFRFELGRQ
jgi:hypothetical protein